MIDIDWIDISSDASMGDEVFISGASYYDKSRPVDNALIELINRWNRLGSNEVKLKYNQVTLIKDDLVDLKIRTYINYSSSNFMNNPYTFTIKEETYRIPKDKVLKNIIEEFVDKSFKNTKDEVADSL